MGAVKYLLIDGDKLRAELDKRNIVPAELSREIGCSDKYIVNACAEGKLRIMVVHYLEKFYGISRDVYKAKPEPKKKKVVYEPAVTTPIEDLKDVDLPTPETPTPCRVSTSLDKDELQRLIADAVCYGMKEAFRDGELKERIRNAVYDGVKHAWQDD